MADGTVPEGKRHLAVLRTSPIKTWMTCPKLYEFEHVKGYTPVEEAKALRLGTVWHLAMEAYLAGIRDGTAVLDGVAVIEAAGLDWVDLARLRPLFVGYCARWESEDRASMEVLSIEREFEHELLNPETGHASKTWIFQGRLDGEVRIDAYHLVLEHKTSSEDISPGSDYWRQKRLDSQASNYLAATGAVGNLYDVARKPSFLPRTATPVEQREYTKPKDKQCPECKKKNAAPGPHEIDIGEGKTALCADGRVVTDPGGRLYANMREFDETPEEYEARVVEAIAADPATFYQRATVVRTADELREAAQDRWDNGRAIADAKRLGRFPRNTSACFALGRRCAFVDVCVGETDVTNTLRFAKKEGF